MSEVFFIGDLHLGHKNIRNWSECRKHFKSTLEHDTEIVARWNKTVGKRDTVWLLGDVVFPLTSMHYLRELAGTINVVLGNHDTKRARKLMEYVNRIEGCVKWKDRVMLTHIPIHPSQLERYSANIHGHLHRESLKDGRYYNVNADHLNLTPRSWDVIRPELQARGCFEKTSHD